MWNVDVYACTCKSQASPLTSDAFFFLSRAGLELGGLVIIRSFSYLFYGSFLTLYHMKKHLVGFHASENQGEKLV